jgi:hypothetical protein
MVPVVAHGELHRLTQWAGPLRGNLGNGDSFVVRASSLAPAMVGLTPSETPLAVFTSKPASACLYAGIPSCIQRRPVLKASDTERISLAGFSWTASEIARPSASVFPAMSASSSNLRVTR